MKKKKENPFFFNPNFLLLFCLKHHTHYTLMDNVLPDYSLIFNLASPLRSVVLLQKTPPILKVTQKMWDVHQPHNNIILISVPYNI